MNKKQVILIVSIVVFIAALVGISVLLNNVNNPKSNTNTKASSTKAEIERISINTWNEKVTNETKYVLIDFYADWCGPCRMLSPLIEEVASDSNYSKDFAFYKVNVDYEQQLSTNYSVQYLPTLVIFKDGKEVTRSVGYLEKEQLIQFIQSVK